MEIKQLFNINFDNKDGNTLLKAYNILDVIEGKMEQFGVDNITQSNYNIEISYDDISTTTKVLNLLSEYGSWNSSTIDE